MRDCRVLLLLLVFLLMGVFSGCGKQPESKAVLPVETDAPFETRGTASPTPPMESAEADARAKAAGTVRPSDATFVPDIDIKEKLFIAQINDIYIRPEDYMGKTIRYEGLFTQYNYPFDETSETTVSMVYRYGPGCCGYDGMAGFEVAWDGASPRNNDWVEAVGVLETYEENGITYLRLALKSLKVLDERGAEIVTQ